MSKKTLIIYVLVFLTLAFFFLNQKKDSLNEEVKLFYYNPNLDLGPGGPECTEKGLVSVSRTIPDTQNHIKDTVNLLLKGDLRNEEKADGLTTEFPLQGFELGEVIVNDSTVTLIFSDPQNSSSGGSCRVSILRAQIENTAKQFKGVENVIILPVGVLEP